MKFVLATIAALTLAGPAFAQATLNTKTSNSQGTAEGVGASSATGNGDYVGGNGTSGFDQTTAPGSRVDALKDAGMLNGKALGTYK